MVLKSIGGEELLPFICIPYTGRRAPTIENVKLIAD